SVANNKVSSPEKHASMGGSLERCLCPTTPVQNREASVCPRFARPLTLRDRGQERKGSTEQSEPFAPVPAPSLEHYAGWPRAGRHWYHRGRTHHALHLWQWSWNRLPRVRVAQ